jgi:hypothetical protein
MVARGWGRLILLGRGQDKCKVALCAAPQIAVILSAAKDLAGVQEVVATEILRCAQNDGAALRMTVLRLE